MMLQILIANFPSITMDLEQLAPPMKKMTHALIIITKNKNVRNIGMTHNNHMSIDKEQGEGIITTSINPSSETLANNQKIQLIYHI